MNRYSLGNTDNKFNPRSCGFHDGIGGKGRRHKDHTAVSLGVADSLLDCIKNGDAVHFKAPLAGSNPGNDMSSIGNALAGMELPFSASYSLDQKSGVFIYKNTHNFQFVEFLEFVGFV